MTGIKLRGLVRGVSEVIEEFGPGAEARWRFFTDQVMGGVSEGRAQVDRVGGHGHLHLTGTVSTANNGGFIQARRELETPLPQGARGLILRARGDGGRYFVHLRSRATRLPWQYYQAGFETHAEWRDAMLPFAAFRPSGRLLPARLRPETVRSIALVAYGRDHEADLSVTRISVY